MSQAAAAKPIDMTPAQVIYPEKIGDTTWQLQHGELDIFEDIRLWHENPRILPHLPQGAFPTEAALEEALVNSKGYDALMKSIREMGQMEPVYVWRKDSTEKYIVLEGSTRVTILRDLARKSTEGKNAGKYNRAFVKILPPNFGLKERAILLARIHVRGDGVRSWSRFTQAEFLYDYVEGDKALMSVSDMAGYMGKSIGWVMRLRDAYKFALKFIEHIDDEENGERIARDQFSTLEEISKATGIGPHLREFEDSKYDQLRDDVFDMVHKGVFSEYRDARFLKQFHDDADKWAQLKSGEPGIASRLAAEIKTNGSTIKAKISTIDAAVERAMQRSDHGLDEEDITHLKNAVALIQQDIHAGVHRYRLDLKNITALFENTNMADVKALQDQDIAALRKAVEYFEMLVEKYREAA